MPSRDRKLRERNKDKSKKWRLNNRDKKMWNNKRWCLNNRDKKVCSNKIWRLKNHDKSMSSSKVWRLNNRYKSVSSSKLWRMQNPHKSVRSCEVWRTLYPDKILFSRKQWRQNNSIMVAKNLVKWYLNNCEKARSTRKLLYKRHLMRERQYRQQRYKINLFIESQYFRGKNRGLIKTGNIVAQQKFQSIVVKNICKTDNIKLPDIGTKLKAESLVVKCLNLRTKSVYELKSAIHSFKNKCNLFLKEVSEVDSVCIEDICGKCEHRQSREPYFNECSYLGGAENDLTKGPQPCNSDVCIFPENAVIRLMNLLKHFEKVNNFRKVLVSIDKCCCTDKEMGKKGHPIPCLPNNCSSDFLFLRQLAVHFPKMSTLVRRLYEIREMDNLLCKIDHALIKGDVTELKKFVEISVNSKITVSCNNENDKVNCEKQLETLSYAKDFFKSLNEYPNFVCACCNLLHYRKSVAAIRFDYDELNELKIFVGLKNRERAQQNCNELWMQLFASLEIRQFDLTSVFLCYPCLSCLKQGKQHASLSIFNILEVAPMPNELACLNDFEKILIQKAKVFHIIYRLGAVGSKLPMSDRLKALKGQVIYYPLPLNETLSTLPAAEQMPLEKGLDILVFGVPTKNKMVWQSVVDVKKVKDAIIKLKNINLEYKSVNVADSVGMTDVSDESVPETSIMDACNLVAKKSMLRKIDKSGEAQIFESFTVHPLQCSKPKESDIELYQMERVEAQYLDSRESKLDILCFPVLFPTGRGGKGEERHVKLSNADWIRSRLLNADPRFRRDQQYLFHLLHEYHLRGVQSAVLQSLRNSYSYNDMNVSQFLKLVKNGQQQLEGNLFTMFKQVRGSAEYFASKRLDLRCMVRELGPPTWFVTLSAAEYDWEDMSKLLIELNKDIEGVDSMRNGERCAMDPVFVSKQFHVRFSNFFRIVLCHKGGGPLGEIVDFFWRVEYQARGAPHYHMLLWVKNAPKIGVQSGEEVLHFIQKHVSCCLPDKDTEPLLHNIVSRYQIHRVCNNYCMRACNVNGKHFKKCRFGFPRKPTDEATLRDPLATCNQRSKGMSECRLYELPRTLDEVRVNDYNPIVSLLWGANTDVQFVGDNTSAVVNYIVSYITKKEESGLQEMWEEIDKNQTLSKRLYKFCLRKLSTRECGAYEAADTLLGHHLYGKSHEVKYVCARQPHLRPRQLKTIKMLKCAVENDPHCVDKYENDLIGTYYPDRADCLENMCLYDFARLHDRSSAPSSSRLAFKTVGGSVVVRTKPYLISHPVYRYEDQLEDYCYSLLLLFKPFRNESAELLDESGKCSSVFENELLCNSPLAEHHNKMCALAKVQENNKKVIESDITNNNKIETTDVLPVVDALGEPFEAANAMCEFAAAMQMNAGDDLAGNVANMNCEQRAIFDTITNHLTNSTQQLMQFISGAGGTGKSFIITTLKLWAKQYYNVDMPTIAVVAPTGLAAYNINGMTLHRLLQLPVQHGGTAKYNKLSDIVCKELKQALKYVKLLVIDEVSMVSNLMLTYTHLRLTEIFNCEELFGGLNVVVMGDFAQLTPVNASPVFVSLTSNEVAKKIGGLCGMNIWIDNFVIYDELLISMRQKDDCVYAELLSHLRFGCATDSDVAILQSRLIPLSNNCEPHVNLDDAVNFFLNLRDCGSQCVCLMPTTKMVTEFNKHALVKEGKDIVKLVAENSFEFTARHSKQLKDSAIEILNKMDEGERVSETAGIEASINLCIGCRVMLRRNIDVDSGLVNGAIGVVTGFEKIGATVEYVLVKFDNVSDVQKISKVTVKFSLNKFITVSRKQFPLVLSYAMTIHKSQGLSLTCVMVDVGNRIFQPGMTYVALSRVRTLDGLHLINFDPSQAVANQLCTEEINRLRTLYLPHLNTVCVANKKLNWIPDRVWCKSSVAEKVNKKQKEIQQRTRKSKISKVVEQKFKNSSCDNAGAPRKKLKLNSCNTNNSNNVFIQWPKFDNSRFKLGCYSNAALQCLFSLPQLNNASSVFINEVENVKREMYNLIKLYEERKINGCQQLFTSKLRHALGNPFRNQDGMQCAFEFVRTLLLHVGFTNMFQFFAKIKRRCNHCNAPSNLLNEQSEIQLFLKIQFNGTSNFADALTMWEPLVGFHCPACFMNNSIDTQIEIIHGSDLLLMYVSNHTGVNGADFNDVSVYNFNSENVKINNYAYKVVAAIQHFGESSMGGHYVALVRSNSYGWLLCDDHEISRIQCFPNDLRHISLLFLQRLY